MPSDLLEGDCPPEEDFAAFRRGGLDAEGRRALEAHVARCSPCRRLLSALADASGVDSAADASSVSPTIPLDASALDVELRLGRHFGRYVVRELLGTGGMGVVYVAEDPELKRKVALKVLRREGGGAAADRKPIRDTLLREAQAMAQLAHPNVVAVYDVGTVDDRVFIAMELVDGQTLSRWLAATQRSPSEIIAAFIAAGYGLASAHAAGMIHRDFKPDNVLIGNDGRVRVTDFGLARAAPPAALETARRGSADPSGGTGSYTGLAGTLAYMAPEQFTRKASDARADQFSFAVALHEALYGERPFTGPPQRSYAAPARARGDVPVAVRDVLQRALRVEPGERYPSMTELLSALTPKPRRGRRVAAAAVIATACLVAGAGGLVIHLARAADQRAQRTGQLLGVAAEMPTALRLAHTLPQQDIRAARDQVRRMIRDVQAQRARVARQDERALIDFVVGEGYRALGDYPHALEALEAAWAGGERTPQIDASLGYVLGTVYARGLDDIEETVPADRRAAKLRALEQRYRDPAMVHLRAALAARVGSPAYLEALMAFHQHRYPDASRWAHTALTAAPTFYEAGMLEAEAEHFAALDLMIGGHQRESLDTFTSARKISARMVEIARSDDDAWLAYGDILYTQAAWFIGDRLQGELQDQAIVALHTVTAINPERWEPWLREAHLYQGESNRAIIELRDPSAEVAKVLALGEQARAHGAPGNEVDVLVCLAHWAQAIYDGNHGRDPHRELDLASAACDRAAAVKPGATVYASLAAVESALAAYNGNHGVDPMPAVTLGERNLRAAIAIDDSAVWRYSLGRLWIAVAHYQDDRGQDPERAIVRVLSELELSTRMDATRADAWATRAEALILRARQQRADHVDTTSTLAAARAALERALEISPTMAAPLRHRMALAELDAEALLEHHADPGAAVARIRADAQALLARVPNDGVSHRLWCSAELLAARWAVAHGNPVEPLLVQAARHATQARETDPMDPRAWVASAAVEQLRAGAAHARGTPTDASIARGLAFAERALALAPGLVCARVVRDNLQRAR